eukprot:6209185-Pleurochrysis_carterae.AAC.4
MERAASCSHAATFEKSLFLFSLLLMIMDNAEQHRSAFRIPQSCAFLQAFLKILRLCVCANSTTIHNRLTFYMFVVRFVLILINYIFEQIHRTDRALRAASSYLRFSVAVHAV